MNKHKQSKSSIIFTTCWTSKGASTEEICDALDEAGYYMPIDKRLKPMLKTYQRKGFLKKRRNNWIVSLPYTSHKKATT